MGVNGDDPPRTPQTFQLEISQWAGDQWVPFSADDVQVEFRMLHPYERRTLKDEGNGTFSVAFRAPDVYGSFHFAGAPRIIPSLSLSSHTLSSFSLI